MKFQKNDAHLIIETGGMLHDSVYIKSQYDYSEKNLILYLEPYFDDGYGKIVFCNVIAYEAETCEFWGKSDRVNAMGYIEEEKSVLIKKVFEKATQKHFSLLIKSKECYMELLVELISGDYIRVLCESVEFLH